MALNDICYDDAQLGFFLAYTSSQDTRSLCIQLPDGLFIWMPQAYL